MRVHSPNRYAVGDPSADGAAHSLAFLELIPVLVYLSCVLRQKDFQRTMKDPSEVTDYCQI